MDLKSKIEEGEIELDEVLELAAEHSALVGATANETTFVAISEFEGLDIVGYVIMLRYNPVTLQTQLRVTAGKQGVVETLYPSLEEGQNAFENARVAYQKRVKDGRLGKIYE